MGIGEHVTAGAVLTYSLVYVGNYIGLEVTPLAGTILVAGGIFGAMLPDIDIEESFLGRKAKGLSCLINSWFGHRTLTHSLFFMVVVGGLVALINPVIGFGLGLGILSHIVLDMFNGRGVAYLYPFLKKRIKWFTIIK